MKKPLKHIRASLRPGRKLIIASAEGTRLKGLRAIPADRREQAVQDMLRYASGAHAAQCPIEHGYNACTCAGRDE